MYQSEEGGGCVRFSDDEANQSKSNQIKPVFSLKRGIKTILTRTFCPYVCRMKSFFYLSLGLLTLALVGCRSNSSNSWTGSIFGGNSALVTGADRTNKYVPYLQGKRIGMVVNQSSTIGGEPSVDRLLETGVQVKKIFGTRARVSR